MKNLLLTIVIFSVLLLIGCQENSLTEPTTINEFQKADDLSVNTGTILLEGMLRDPHPVMNSYYIISGEIQYQHKLISLDPIPPNPQYLVSLNLSVSAGFAYFCTVCSPPADDVLVGTIFSETNDNIYIPEKGNYLLVKTFEILGRDDGMMLKCSFLVTKDGVSLNSMNLTLMDNNTTNNTSNKTSAQDTCIYPPIKDSKFNHL